MSVLLAWASWQTQTILGLDLGADVEQELYSVLMSCVELHSATNCSYCAYDMVKMEQLNLPSGCESKSLYMGIVSAVELVLNSLEAGSLYIMQYEKF